MESVDVVLIKLLGVVKDKEKSIVGRWIKRTTSRDFRLKSDRIEAEQEKVCGHPPSYSQRLLTR
jgi:hypothetical protein